MNRGFVLFTPIPTFPRQGGRGVVGLAVAGFGFAVLLGVEFLGLGFVVFVVVGVVFVGVGLEAG